MAKAITLQQAASPVEDELRFYLLEGLLPPGRAICVNTTQLIVSSVSTAVASGNPIHMQRSLTELQMRLLLTLLESPGSCPHELLHTSLFCPYEVLLKGLFSPDRSARIEWLGVVQQYRLRLRYAQQRGMWRKELKRLYNVLSELRAKLRPFGLGISVSELDSAYRLVALSYAAGGER
ncbi:MAG TPA: hypothetical protein VNE38_04740 [Ktedonobacteraceae bacterium]|nr:hypothetical protein [Ktedonobacteraceae bacterium]